MSRVTMVALLVNIALATPATAESTDSNQSVKAAEADGYAARPKELKPGSLLGGTIAVMPGIVFHGLGHAYTKDYGTAIGLFCAELVGIGMMIGSHFLHKDSGGDYQTAALEQSMSHLGFMLFISSWAADVIGTYKGSAPFGVNRRAAARPLLGLTYRYADNPLNRFRHHMQLKLDLQIGRFYVRPAIDLEAQLSRREVKVEFGARLWGESIVDNHLSLGVRTGRLENRTDGWAAHTAIVFLHSRFDLGRYIDSLKRFYLINRLGYGIAGYQFDDSSDNVPALMSETALTDTWVYLESGVALSVGTGTDLSVTLVQDPTGVVSPIHLSSYFSNTSQSEAISIELNHRYENEAGIQVQFVGGAGFGVWLGLEYAL